MAASRTYIQQLLKLHKAGKEPLYKELIEELEAYASFLEDHPELVEKVIRARVNFAKAMGVMFPDKKLKDYHFVYWEMCVVRRYLWPDKEREKTYYV